MCWLTYGSKIESSSIVEACYTPFSEWNESDPLHLRILFIGFSESMMVITIWLVD